MISISEAAQLIQSNKPERIISTIDLIYAPGCVLAEKIIAPVNSPGYNNSAMDGFAVRWDDVENVGKDNNISLKIAGESRAGLPYNKPIYRGEAIRISTGAMIPDDCSAVVPVEDTEFHNNSVIIKNKVRYRQNIRFIGEDFKVGDVLLDEGTIINPPKIALIASIGINSIKVYKSPSIAIITTGSELVPFDTVPEVFQVRDSNSIMLASALKLSGANIITHRRIEDSLDDIRAAIESESHNNQIIILSGGVSMGNYDFVRSASEQAGFKPVYWKVNQKPGKPFFFAAKENKLLFGLPGNPVSAYMVYTYYIHPLIQYLNGINYQWRITSARLVKPFTNQGSRTLFARVKMINSDTLPREATVIENQGSHIISSISSADGFIIVEGKQTIEEHKIIEIYLFPGWQ